MATIKPFPAVHYNEEKVGDLSNVICPPYDVIDSELQEFYYKQSPFNYIRLILNKQNPSDTPDNNRYTRALTMFREWLKAGILEQDTQPAFYVYQQEYFCQGKERARLGFLGAMELQDEGGVLPHENTHHAPKMDRLELMKKVRANLSPIFTLFADTSCIIEKIRREVTRVRKPDFVCKDADGVRNSMWRVIDKKLVDAIARAVKDAPVFIADGHHRCEVGKMYRNLMKEEDGDYSAQKGYNYIMTYFTSTKDAGLVVLPIHRVVTERIDPSVLREHFDIVAVPSLFDVPEKLDSYSPKECVCGLYVDGKAYLLKLKDKKRISGDFIRKPCFKNLDVAIIDYFLLKDQLHIEKEEITYVKDIREAEALINAKTHMSAFILRPTAVNEIKEVALCGERMPPKSTYFYPKLLSGLVAYSFGT